MNGELNGWMELGEPEEYLNKGYLERQAGGLDGWVNNQVENA